MCRPNMNNDRGRALTKAVGGFLTVFACLGVPDGLTAQAVPPSTSPSQDRAKPEEFRPRLLVLPFLYYTPETKLAVGAGGLLSFRVGEREARTRASTIWAFGNYTLAKQFQVSVNPQIYFERNNLFVSGNFRYERTPQKFYGVGDDLPEGRVESYTPRIVLLQATMMKRLLGGFYAGLLLDLEKTTMEKLEPGGVLETAGLAGSRGGLVSGVGLSLDWDTRDKVQFPRKGMFLQLAAFSYTPVSGSDYSFSSVKLDLRRYVSLAEGQVLALQTVLRFTSGDTPFYRLSMLGGDSLVRGYYKGRFRDKDMIVGQAEYRVVLGRRFGAAAFAALGQVFPRFSDLALKRLKYSLGTGIRYSLDPRERTNVRMDLAWGVRSFGLYFTAQEAF